MTNSNNKTKWYCILPSNPKAKAVSLAAVMELASSSKIPAGPLSVKHAFLFWDSNRLRTAKSSYSISDYYSLKRLDQALMLIAEYKPNPPKPKSIQISVWDAEGWMSKGDLQDSQGNFCNTYSLHAYKSGVQFSSNQTQLPVGWIPAREIIAAYKAIRKLGGDQ